MTGLVNPTRPGPRRAPSCGRRAARPRAIDGIGRNRGISGMRRLTPVIAPARPWACEAHVPPRATHDIPPRALRDPVPRALRDLVPRALRDAGRMA